jgi:Peptidase family M48
MNAGLDKQLLQEFYERMTDDEIVRIVTNDVAGLTPEAREVITVEVKKRRLDVDTSAITGAESGTESPGEWYMEEGCPVHQQTRIWLENSFLTLLSIFGEQRTQYRKVLTAERSDFPIKFDGSEQAACETLKIVATQMEIPPDKITLDFYDENMRRITEGTPSGLYWGKGETDKFEISVARTVLDEPEEMIAVLAHELAHVKLLGEQKVTENDELITDLTTILFGLGVFNANAAFRTFNDAKHYGWSQMGYLSQMEWGYGLALFAYIRKELQPDWADYLCTNVKDDFFKGLQFIADNEDIIFKEQPRRLAGNR